MKTLQEAVNAKEFFINTILKKFPKLCRDDVDNIFSTVIYRILVRSNQTFPQNLKHYIIKAMINEIRSLHRSSKRGVVLILSDKFYMDAFIEYLEMFPVYKTVRKHIYTLPELSKQTLILKFRFKLTNLEIARLFNISINTVKSRAFEGQKVLKKLVLNDL